MAPLPIGSPELPWPRALESPARLANGITARFATAARPAVGLSSIAPRAEKEHLLAIATSAENKSDGEHGRAAREVGPPNAVMRCLLAITAE
jgi:hypothetical protein